MNPEIVHELISTFIVIGGLFIVLAIALEVVKVWYGIRRKP